MWQVHTIAEKSNRRQIRRLTTFMFLSVLQFFLQILLLVNPNKRIYRQRNNNMQHLNYLHKNRKSHALTIGSFFQEQIIPYHIYWFLFVSNNTTYWWTLKNDGAIFSFVLYTISDTHVFHTVIKFIDPWRPSLSIKKKLEQITSTVLSLSVNYKIKSPNQIKFNKPISYHMLLFFLFFLKL